MPEENIKNVINNLFGAKSKLAKSYKQYTAEQVWRETFGDLISRYTTSVKLYNGVLTVFITSAPLKQELSYTKEKVIERMNENMTHTKVTSLIIR